MKIIITGVNGYIGSHLAKFLADKGHQVIGVSRKYYEGVAAQLSHCELMECDIFSDTFKKLRMPADAMIHLASANDIVSKEFEKGVELSLYGTKNALDVCVKNNIKQFIFFSTMQVYESELKGNYDEAMEAKPVNDYALNHLIAEDLVALYSRKHKMKCASVRPSNVYGAMMDKQIERWSLVPNCFVKEAVEKGTITLLSSGKQLRNFVSLNNVVRSTEAILADLTDEYEVFNIASENNYSIIDVANFTKDVFKTAFNKEVEVIVKSEEPTVANEFKISIEKLNDFGIKNMESEVALKGEIKKIIELFK